MHRAFVIQLAADSETGALRGRVEHVRSGRSIHFDGLVQLADFLAQSVEHETLLDRDGRRPELN